MIEFTKAYKTKDGQTHASLEDAKKHELRLLFGSAPMGQDLDQQQHAAVINNAVACVLNHANAVVDILTTTTSSKPRARKVNGGSRRRADKPAEAPAAAAA